MRLLLSLTAAAACFACSLSANADPILSIKAFDLTGGTNAISLTSVPTSSSSTFSFGSNADFSVSVTANGASVANGGLSTNTLDARGLTGTSLLLEITQTGLTALQASQLFNLSYTLNTLSAGGSGAAVFTTFVDGSNAQYGTAVQLNKKTLSGANSVASYTASATGTGLSPNGLYSETQYIQINFAQAGSISASSQLTPTSATPEPSSLALLGTGLLGIAGMARRRFSRS